MFGIPNLYMILAGVVGFAAITGGTYITGHTQGYNKAETEYKLTISQMQAAAIEEKEQAKQKMLIDISNASQGFEDDRAKTRIIYRTRVVAAEKVAAANPIYLNACFDDAGLQLVNAALGDFPVNPALSPEPSAAMPKVITPQ